MSAKIRTYIFHIHRNDGTSMFLHPFRNPDKLVGQLEKQAIDGRYGQEPRVEALTMFRNELYRQVELGVRSWVSDQRFIPKFLISAGVFVLAYFFASFVIRDPLPVIDELAIALGLSIGAFVVQGRRDLNSRLATEKRLALRVIVDRVTFRESDFVKQVEEALHRHEGGRIEGVLAEIVEPARAQVGGEQREEVSQFLQLLEGRFNFHKLQREEKNLRRLLRSSSERDITRLFESKKYDFPLYAVYKSFKKTVTSPR
jgi:hypothetical protein